MFMVKDEFKNIRNLVTVGVKTQTRVIVWVLIIFTLVLLISLADNVISYFGSLNSVHYTTVVDYSITLMIGTFIGYIVGAIMYRRTTAKLSVFPQTNNSRYISWLIQAYATVVFIALMLTVMYLIHYGVILLLMTFDDSIYLALNIDFGFIVAGFFVYVAYSFLIVAVIELIAAVIRKWSYYAVATLITLLTLMVINLERVIEYIARLLSFLITEPSLILFFLKAIGIWLIITAATLIINHFTMYYKSQNWVLKKRITIACVIIAMVIIIVTPMIFRFSITIYDNTQNTGFANIEAEWDSDRHYNENFFGNMEEIRIDISHLPAGVNININGENIHVVKEGPTTFYTGDIIAYIFNSLAVKNVQGDTLIVQYASPFFLVNGIEIFHFADPQVSVYMEENTLFINYTFDKVTVIIMPVWSMVRQFDIFADKNLLTAHAMGSSGGGSMSVNVFIDVE